MNYLTRPVFETAIDWKNPINKEFSFDLRDLALGFGAEVFLPLQTNVVQGYSAQVWLDSSAEIDAFDAFFAALTGRLQGFWLPAPFLAFEIVGADDASHFFIRDQGLRDTLADHPDVYLYLTRPGLAARACKITGVAAATEDRERVTLSAALATPVTTADTALRLHYVRLATDVERGQFYKENCQRRELKVVELPTEYEAYETGAKLIHLYHFWTAEPMNWHWRFTSFAADVVSGNKLFTKYAMRHGTIRKSLKLENETLELEAAFNENHPLALFLPIPFSRPLNVEVLEVSYADPDTQRSLFVGRVRNVPDNSDRLVAKCDSWAGVLARKFPGLQIGAECNWQVFDRNCGLERWNKDTSAEVVSVDDTVYPPTATLQLIAGSTQEDDWMTTDWFARGFIELGNGLTFQVRTILSSVGDAPNTQITIELNHKLFAAVGQRVRIVPGCDGTAATCKSKFRNFPNFGGFPAVPEKNLSLQAMDATTSAGGKK